jgi:hypothetical protein
MTQTPRAGELASPLGPSTAGWAWACLPLAITAVVYVALAGQSAWVRATRMYPITPWESAIVVDGWRVTQGLPVYADPAVDHATHMYGPLITYASAPLVRAFGPDVRIPRGIALASAVTLCALAAWVLADRSPMVAVLVFSLGYLQFYRAGEWSTEGRPDAAAALVSGVALALLYRAQQARGIGRAAAWTVAGTAATLAAVLLKQPAAAVSLVPPILLATRRPSPLLPHLLLSLAPIASIAACFLVLKLAFPWVYFHMVSVPASYPVRWLGWCQAIMEWIRFDVLFVAALLMWVALRAMRRAGDAINSWLAVTVLVSGLLGAAARAKVGGGFNSFLPSMLAGSFLGARVLPRFFGEIAQRVMSVPAALLLGIILAAALVADLAAVLHVFKPGVLIVRHGDQYYPLVVARASALPGMVISPDDPTIALRAKGYAGRCGDCEMDANHRTLPDFALDEVRRADWLIQVVSSRRPTVSDEHLLKLGFRKAEWKIPAQADYVLWQRIASSSP